MEILNCRIKNLLKRHKNQTLESQVQHLRRLIVDPDKAPDLQRETLVRELHEKSYGLQQQLKLMHKQYQSSVQGLLDEKNLLLTENKIIRRELGQKSDKNNASADTVNENQSRRIVELVNLIDDM